MEREHLRTTFNEDAALYDRARPDYPADLIEDVSKLADIGPGSRVLEIGAGTGKATVALAERGGEIIAVELGADMVAVAQRNLARFRNVRWVESSFEDWPLPPEPFDTVVSATAWHWIDPRVRVIKAAGALRPRGALALITTHHVAGGDEDFFVQVQECYERWDSATPPGLRLPSAEEIPTDEELNASGRFDPLILRRYEKDITYSTGEYREFLLTYSGHRALEPVQRAPLLDCIAHLIDSRYRGSVTKRYLYQLQVAYRRIG